MISTAEEYVSIFLEPGWVSEDYYGWRVVAHDPGRMKVLCRRQAGVPHYLVLIRGVNDAELETTPALDVISVRSITTIHDFSSTSDTARVVRGHTFLPAPGDERMLNTATYVVDLTQQQELLWANLGGKSRNMVRRAEGSGMTTDFGTRPEVLDRFLELYEVLAVREQLRPVDVPALKKMLRDRRLLLASGAAGNGEPFLVNLVYTSGRHAYFLHGASTEDIPPGAGQCLHWQTTLFLKSSGYGWYDLGGVPPDPTHGISRFKSSLGGAFCDLGREFRYTPAVLGAARRIYRKVRSHAGRWRSR